MTRQGISIVDYGMGNLRSVQKAFERVGFAAEITSNPDRIRHAAKVVLPGVGAFRDASVAMHSTGLGAAVREHIQSGMPFLGICLGLQLLFERSHEEGTHRGLGIFPGDVVRFPEQPGLKVPHMGWNTLAFPRIGCPLFANLPKDPAVYFVHGYYPVPAQSHVIAATSDYPDPFCAAIWQDNVFATQFHPEKSQTLGMIMLENFAKL